MAYDPIFYFLSDDAGNDNAIGDFRTDTTDFKLTNDREAQTATLERMLVYIKDDNNMGANQYGKRPALDNGIRVLVLDETGNEKFAMDGGVGIKTNAAWGRVCFDTERRGWGAQKDFITVRWTFGLSGNSLPIPPGYSLAVRCSDNLSGLDEHRFMVQGYWKKGVTTWV